MLKIINKKPFSVLQFQGLKPALTSKTYSAFWGISLNPFFMFVCLIHEPWNIKLHEVISWSTTAIFDYTDPNNTFLKLKTFWNSKNLNKDSLKWERVTKRLLGLFPPFIFSQLSKGSYSVFLFVFFICRF